MRVVSVHFAHIFASDRVGVGVGVEVGVAKGLTTRRKRKIEIESSHHRYTTFIAESEKLSHLHFLRYCGASFKTIVGVASKSSRIQQSQAKPSIHLTLL